MLAYFDIDENGKVLFGSTNPKEGSICVDVTQEILFNIQKYIYDKNNNIFVEDENYVEPEKPKTEVEKLQEENARLKERQSVMEEALDDLILQSASSLE